MPKLQIALDSLLRDQASELSDQICDVIDIIEVGTPMIVRDGLHTVSDIKKKHPHLTVLADTKIVDGGSIECEDACRAGADIITVLALADNSTVTGVIETAHKYGRKVMADLINVRNIPKRAAELLTMGIDYICVHTAFDVQKEGRTPLGDLKALLTVIPGSRAAVAGGINKETLHDYLALTPAIIIMGSALYNTPDIRKAITEIKSLF